jgi:hypothetical protein
MPDLPPLRFQDQTGAAPGNGSGLRFGTNGFPQTAVRNISAGLQRFFAISGEILGFVRR